MPPILETSCNDSENFIMADHLSNRSTSPFLRPFLPGIYVPTVAFFQPVNEHLDIQLIGEHAVRLAKSGVAGIATQGSNGEAVHLSDVERSQVTSATRSALDSNGFNRIPILVGCSAESVRQTLKLCDDAMNSGGDAALILPPSYYKGQYHFQTVFGYYLEIASKSPIPIFIYNYPPVAGGTDLTSDEIIKLAKAHPNIIGCKLTCGNTGKLNRVASATDASTIFNKGSGFLCLGGSADFILQALVGGGSGAIAGYANIAPVQCIYIQELVREGKWDLARAMQATVARGDWAAIQGGVVGLKSAMQHWLGYGGACRKPLPDVTRVKSEAYSEAMGLERSLEKKAAKAI